VNTMRVGAEDRKLLVPVDLAGGAAYTVRRNWPG